VVFVDNRQIDINITQVTAGVNKKKKHAKSGDHNGCTEEPHNRLTNNSSKEAGNQRKEENLW
jgi:hypothetical protein